MQSIPSHSRQSRGISLTEIAISVIVLGILVIVGLSASTVGTIRSIEISQEKVARDIAHSRVEQIAQLGRPQPLPGTEVVSRNNTEYSVLYSERMEGGGNRQFVVITITIEWGDGETYEIDTVAAP